MNWDYGMFTTQIPVSLMKWTVSILTSLAKNSCKKVSV